MKIGETNYIQQLQLHNEKALLYVIDKYGSLLMAVNNGSNLVWELNKLGIEASVIGRITDGNDRIIRNQEETRYLDLPQADEIYKMNI